MTEPTPGHTPENMARWWGQDPLGVVRGAHEGLAAAARQFNATRPFEVQSAPDPTTHILSPILRGEVDCELFLDGRRSYRRQFRVGTLSLVRTGEAPRSVQYTANITLPHLYLPHASLERFVEYELSTSPARLELLPLQVERDETVAAIAKSIHAKMRTPGLGSRLLVDGLTLQLAGPMVRRWSNLSEAGPQSSSGGLAPWQVQRVTDYLSAHLAHDIPLAALAALVDLSPHHFCRAFKQSTGLPPHRWQLEQRIHRAQALLTHTQASITAVAAEVGYDDPGQFATAFRRLTGITPSRYRRSERKDSGA